MKQHSIFLSASTLLLLGIIFLSCNKDSTNPNLSAPSPILQNEEASERTTCSYYLGVDATQNGGSGGNPWVFELTYFSGGVVTTKTVIAAGRSTLSIDADGSQSWELYSATSSNNITVTATLWKVGTPKSSGLARVYNITSGVTFDQVDHSCIDDSCVLTDGACN